MFHYYLLHEIFASTVLNNVCAKQVLKERIAWLEATNQQLRLELHEYRSRCAVIEQSETEVQVCK